jgi:hypothetical protein
LKVKGVDDENQLTWVINQFYYGST